MPRLELAALIEEARRRARRRRVGYAATGIAALLLGVALYGAIELTNGVGTAGGKVPAGFEAMQARGPVQHALAEVRWRSAPRSINVSTGDVRPAKVTREVWWDRTSGLERVVQRIDGRVQYDIVGQECGTVSGPNGGRRFCAAPPPFYLREDSFGRRVDPQRVREVRSAFFRGRKVIWVTGLPTYGGQVAIDAKTREPRLIRMLSRKHEFIAEQVYTVFKDLPPNEVRFAIPEGGLPTRPYFSFPPPRRISVESRAAGLRAARDALGRTPVWLGARFLGHPIRAVEVGEAQMKGRTGITVRSAKFVRFDYGIIALKEFGPQGSFSYEQGPRPGYVALDGPRRAALSSGGLLVVITRHDRSFRLTPRKAIAIAKALRPMPGR